ncbi:MAG: hypothetical protein R3F14_31935 [Polyangiaceae bacterium]
MTPLRIASFVSLGTGGAGVIAGAVLGGAAIEKRNELNKYCAAPDAITCEASAAPLIQQGKSLADASTTLFVVGGTALAGGLGLLVADHLIRPQGPRIEVSVRPGHITVGGTF